MDAPPHGRLPRGAGRKEAALLPVRRALLDLKPIQIIIFLPVFLRSPLQRIRNRGNLRSHHNTQNPTDIRSTLLKTLKIHLVLIIIQEKTLREKPPRRVLNVEAPHQRLLLLVIHRDRRKPLLEELPQLRLLAPSRLIVNPQFPLLSNIIKIQNPPPAIHIRRIPSQFRHQVTQPHLSPARLHHRRLPSLQVPQHLMNFTELFFVSHNPIRNICNICHLQSKIK